MLDHVKLERAESEIDKFISSRSKGRETANEEAKRQKAEDRRRHDEYREQCRVLWAIHLRRLAGSYLTMARDARRRARELENQPKGKTA